MAPDREGESCGPKNSIGRRLIQTIYVDKESFQFKIFKQMWVIIGEI